MTEYTSKEELIRFIEGLVATQVAQAIESFVQRNAGEGQGVYANRKGVKVEEELKSLKEIELARFEAINARFEALQRETDKRIEALHREMDKRFEAIDKRFEAVDARLEVLHREMDKRFEAIDKRFDSLEKRFTFMRWFMLTGFTLVSVLVVIFGLYRLSKVRDKTGFSGEVIRG